MKEKTSSPGVRKGRGRALENPSEPGKCEVPRIDDAIKVLVEKTVSSVGGDFFRSLVGALASAIGVKCAFTVELLEKGGSRAGTLALWVDGIVDNIEYDLKGTPCRNVYEGKACFYPDNVQRLFPEDKWLEDVGAVSFAGIPFIDSNGDVVGHLGVVDDKPMTNRELVEPTIRLFAARAGAELARMRAEEQSLKLKNAIEQTVESVVITDSDGTIEYVNPAAEKITGYTTRELIGANPRVLKSGKHGAEFYKSMWNTIKAGKIWRGCLVNKRKSGELYNEEMDITPVVSEDGEITHFVAVKRDVTKRIRAEEELRQAKKRAEEATRLKDKFVSLVSHDLRSPISSIFSLLRDLKEDLSSQLSEKHNKMLSIGLETCDGTIEMIDRLLNVSMLQSGRIQPRLRLVHAKVTAAMAIESLVHLAENKGIRLIMDIPDDARFYADFDLFCQVVQNLVSNAIKFCAAGDEITIFSPPGGEPGIAVKDTGPGISEAILPDIFRHEVRTTTLGTSGEKGTGLGLPFCMDIMEAHGGTLTVETVEGEGSVFCAKLPAIRPPVFVIANDKSALAVIKEHLDPMEITVVDAQNGEDALKFLRKIRPLLIIADLSAPGMDGFELLERLKANPRTSHIPVIVITPDGSVESKKQAFRLGADDYLTKPVSASELEPRVKRFVE